MSKTPYIPLYIDKWKAMTETITERDRNKIVGAYLDYIVYEKEPRGLTKIGRMLFEFLRSTADDWKKDKGGAPIGNKNAKKKTTEEQPVVSKNNQPVELNSKQPPLYTETETETKTNTNTEGESQRERGTPTLDDVRKFTQDNKLKVNATRFYKYYQARGWQANGQPIHDWKALLESWVETDEPEKPEKSYKPIEPFKTCPVCGSGETSQKGMYAMCLNPECDKTFTWINNEWRVDK